MSWAGMEVGGVGVRAQTGSLVQLMALTEAGLWPYRGESWEGKGGIEGRQTGSVCTLRSVVRPGASSIWPKH